MIFFFTLFIENKDSYIGFLQSIKNLTPSVKRSGMKTIMTKSERLELDTLDRDEHFGIALKMVSKELAGGKRAEEILLLKKLMECETVDAKDFACAVEKRYSTSEVLYNVSQKTLKGVGEVLSMRFFNKGLDAKGAERVAKAWEESGIGKKPKHQPYGDVAFADLKDGKFFRVKLFSRLLQNSAFKKYLADVLDYGLYVFEKMYVGHEDDWNEGFIYYQKYSRKDACRILNHSTNDESTIYGYKVLDDSNCPIFVNYEKEDNISSSTKYKDHFVSQQIFSWMTRSRRTLRTREVQLINKAHVRKLMFVKKNNKESDSFYYLGDAKVVEAHQTTMIDDNGATVPVVNILLQLDRSVESRLYAYINNKPTTLKELTNKITWSVSAKSVSEDLPQEEQLNQNRNILKNTPLLSTKRNSYVDNSVHNVDKLIAEHDDYSGPL